MRITFGVVDDGEGLAPVALTAEEPVAELVIDGRLSDAGALEPSVHYGDAFDLVDEPVQLQMLVCAVDVRGITDEGFGPLAGVERDVEVALFEPRCWRLLDRRNWQIKFAGKVEVTSVATRDSHDRAGSVAHQDVVGNPDRHRLTVDRVGRIRAGEHAGLLARVVLQLELFLTLGLCPIGRNLFGNAGRAGWIGELINERVLGGQDQERRAEQRVGPCCEDADRAGVGGEVDLGAVATPNPIALHGLDRVGPIEEFEVVDQAVGVRGDPHHPLAHVALEYGEVAAVRTAVGSDFFVGNDSAEAGAPVDGRL